MEYPFIAVFTLKTSKISVGYQTPYLFIMSYHTTFRGICQGKSSSLSH